jgi:hypothetical protein
VKPQPSITSTNSWRLCTIVHNSHQNAALSASSTSIVSLHSPVFHFTPLIGGHFFCAHCSSPKR